MAYVAITENLKSQINGVLTDMRDAELQSMDDTALRRAARNDETLLAHIQTQLWDDLIDLQPRLSRFDKKRRVDVQMVFSRPYPERVVAEHFELQIENVNVPVFVSGANMFYVEVSLPGYRKFETLCALEDMYFNRRECALRWEAVTTQVLAFVQSAKSLNEALKLWPDLDRYVPQEFLDRVLEKRAKPAAVSEAAKKLVVLDMDMINTSTVLARMATPG